MTIGGGLEYRDSQKACCPQESLLSNVPNFCPQRLQQQRDLPVVSDAPALVGPLPTLGTVGMACVSGGGQRVTCLGSGASQGQTTDTLLQCFAHITPRGAAGSVAALRGWDHSPGCLPKPQPQLLFQQPMGGA